MRLLAVLLICQLVLFCSSGQGQVANSLSNSEPRTGAELKNRENADIGASVTESILMRIDERIVEEMEHAWRLVGGGTDNKEAVLLLFRMVDGSIQARSEGLTNEQKGFSFKWHPSATAIFHTHPNSVNPQPSRPDRQLADKLGVPIFTLTVRGMYLYDPHTRKVTQIKRGLDWLELSKWNRIDGCSMFSQAQGQQERETSSVESWFTGRSLAEITRALARLRPTAVSQSDKAILIRDLPLVNADNRVEDRRQLDLLHARLARTLKFFERDQIVELIIFRHPQPIVYSKPGVVLVISTEILKILGSDDAALSGIVAHELAHEYVALEFLEAFQSRGLSRIRELELFCDAVAVVVIIDLGFDPARYAQALWRIATYSKESAELNNGQNSHPDVGARLRVISDISAMFSSRSIHSKR